MSISGNKLEIGSLKREKDQLEEKFKAFNKQATRSLAAKDLEIASLKKENRDLKSENIDLKSKVSEEAKRAAMWEGMTQVYKMQLSYKPLNPVGNSEIEDSQAKLASAEKSLKDKDDHIKRLTEEIAVFEKAQAELKASKIQLEKVQSELSKVQAELEAMKRSDFPPPPSYHSVAISQVVPIAPAFKKESKTVESTERPVVSPAVELVAVPMPAPVAQPQGMLGPVVVPSAVPMVAPAPVAVLCANHGPGLLSPKVTEEKAPDDDIATFLKTELGGDSVRGTSLTTTITVNKKAEAVTITPDGNSEIRKTLSAINRVSSSLSGPEQLCDIYLKRLKGLIDLYNKIREIAKTGKKDEESLYKILKRWLEDRGNNHGKNHYIIKLKWKDEVPSVESVTLKPTLSLQHS